MRHISLAAAAAILLGVLIAPNFASAASNFTVTVNHESSTTVKPGGQISVQGLVTSTAAIGDYTIGFELYQNGQLISSATTLYQDLVSKVGGTAKRRFTWTVPTSAVAGSSYNVLIGVWDANWVWYTGTTTTFTVASSNSSSSSSSGGGTSTTQTAPYYSCVTNWYVDAVNGNDSNAGTSPQAAFKTIAKATQQNANLAPGGCVNVAPGTYNEFVWLRNSAGVAGNTNTLTGYVVLRSSGGPGAAKIVGPSSNGYSAVNLPTSYAVIDGFDVSGGDNGNCIDGGYNWQTNHAHHLIVVNNHVHNCGGGGIELSGGDYYIIEGNTSNNNAATSSYQMSGISICCEVPASGFTPTAADNVIYRNVIRNNVSYDNVETFSCSAYGMSAGCHTDGEGIIVDCFDCNGPGKYTYQTLIVGNVLYGNGGNGVQVGRSSNVTVANNTAYDDYVDVNNSGTARSEFANIAGSNNTFVNNIAYAIPGAGILSNNRTLLDTGAMTISGVAYPATNVLWTTNIYYGGGIGTWANAVISGTLNHLENPMLVSPTTNFTLRAGSPAVGTGLAESFLSSPMPDIGAY